MNLAQSALLIGGMGLIAWMVVSTVAGPTSALVAVIGSVLGLLFAPALPESLLLSAYGARRLGGRDFPDGVAILAELVRRAALPRVPALYYVPSRLPNAFAMGAPEDSVICVSDGLLRILGRRELTGVLAHEVSHIANRDLWIMGVADAMSRAVSLVSWLGLILMFLNLPVVLGGRACLPWSVPILLIFSPTLMALLQLALSRMREFDADRGAVELSGEAEGLASALMKLERHVGRFWEEILLPGRRIPEPSLLRTHPPTEARIERLQQLGRSPGRPSPSTGPVRMPPVPRAEPARFRRFGIYR